MPSHEEPLVQIVVTKTDLGAYKITGMTQNKTVTSEEYPNLNALMLGLSCVVDDLEVPCK